jgi:coenzyme F420 hydrogenase subunit beta
MEWEWKLITEECTGCGICADVCRDEAIQLTREMAYPEPVPLACTGCLDCVAQCPFEAIEVFESSTAAE